MSKIKYLALLFCLVCCSNRPHPPVPVVEGKEDEGKTKVVVGARQLDLFLPSLKNKRVALLVNNTSMVGKTHLVDTLKSLGVNIVQVFGPEHGFRGDAADGQHVNDTLDEKTGIPVFSLHGKNKIPSDAQLANVDVVVFDIQDVGARFYTYISTMHYMMDACAKNGKPMIILDRPNPNGSYVDGPVRKQEFKYFLALDPIPIVHGLTVGELAQMINGEGWLESGKKCDLSVIKIKNWTHQDEYSLPVRPSPNLPNDQAIKLYPSLCLFEQTDISVGRGTTMQFQILGSPALTDMKFQFIPVSMPGISNTPPHQDKVCYGEDLRSTKVERKFDLSYLLKYYKLNPDKEKFFLKFFDNLAGTKDLRQQIINGSTEEQIRASWEPELSEFKELRTKYLLYN